MSQPIPDEWVDEQIVHHPARKRTSNIESELALLNLPEEVAICAANIFQSLNIGVVKRRNRQDAIIYCVHYALEEIYGERYSPVWAIGLFGITRAKLASSLNNISGRIKSDYTPSSTNSDPLSSLDGLLEMTRVDRRHWKGVQELMAKVCSHQSMAERRPSEISLACIAHYAFVRGLTWDATLAEATVSKTKIAELVCQVDEIDNCL